MGADLEQGAFERDDGGDADQPQFNWHPLVHRRFGESLYFYLLRFESPTMERVAKQLRATLERAGIEHACEYTIYGYWDALVRVWLTDHAQERWSGVLRPDSGAGVVDSREFRVWQMRQRYKGEPTDLLEENAAVRDRIAQHRSEIIDTVEAGTDADPNRTERLAKAGLLIRRTPVPDGSVKFYFCLQHLHGSRPDASAEEIQAALARTTHESRTTIYSGSGRFADFMIRCVADSYPEVLATTGALDHALRKLQVRPMTLLIADLRARESDNLNELNVFSNHDRNTVKLLKLTDDSHRQFEALPTPNRNALNELVDTLFELSAGDPQLTERLRRILHACLAKNPEQLRERASYLLTIEGSLGTYLKRSWAAEYGRDWVSTLADALEANGHAKESDQVRKPKKWTLGTCNHLAFLSARIDPQLEARYHDELGERWSQQLNVVQDRRNQIAHDGFGEGSQLIDFGGETGQMLRDLMDGATLVFKLEQLNSTPKDGDSTPKPE